LKLIGGIGKNRYKKIVMLILQIKRKKEKRDIKERGGKRG